jgi:siroheme synthase
MNARKLSTVCVLLAALSNLIGCESSRSSDAQFQKQGMRARECRQLQDKLVGGQPLTPERGEEIAKTLNRTGCTARLPARDAGVSPPPALSATTGGPTGP